MTAKTRSNFQTDQATAFADNTAGDITPAVLRAQVVDLSDSAVFPEDVATTEAPGVMSAADKTKLDSVAAGATANAGTVTSVAVSGAGGITVSSGSPITTSGTIALTIADAALTIAKTSGLQTALDAKAPLTVTRTAQTGTAYTLALADAGRVVTMSNAAANTLTIPANATVAFPVGTLINVVQIGDGVTTVTGATGVTVNGASAGSAEISAKWQGLSLLKIDTDEWVASGALA